MRLIRKALNASALIALGSAACSSAGEAPWAGVDPPAGVMLADAARPGAPLFSRSFPGGETDRTVWRRTPRVTGLAVDATTNVWLTGAFQGTLDFGRERLTSGGGAEVFVAKLGPEGSPLWVRRLGGGREGESTAIAADTAGNAFVLGSFEGSVDFGVGPLTSKHPNVFILKLDPAGKTLWSQQLNVDRDEGAASPHVAAAMPAGGVVILGHVDTGAHAGEVELRGDGSFAVALDASGRVLWGNVFGRGGDSIASGVAMDGDQNIVTVESYATYSRIYLAKLDKRGALVWRKRFNAQRDVLRLNESGGVAVDARGDILLAGHGSVDFGVPPAPGSEGEGFVARFDPSGAPRWVRRLPFAGEGRIAADAAGNALVAGASASAIFAAKLSPEGDVLWTQRAEGSADISGIAMRPSGDGLLAGTFRGVLDFGLGPLSSGDRTDIFVAAFAR